MKRAALLILLLIATATPAQEARQEALRGLRGFVLAVSAKTEPRDYASQLPLEQIMSDAKERLLRAGLNVAGADHLRSSPMPPTLKLSIMGFMLARQFVYTITVELYEPANLTYRTDENESIVVSWNHLTFGSTAEPGKVHGYAMEGINKLISDWQAANPKRQ